LAYVPFGTERPVKTFLGELKKSHLGHFSEEESMIRREKTLKNIVAMAGILLVSQWNGALSYGQSAPDASTSGKGASSSKTPQLLHRLSMEISVR
jgi:hypothetical protein